MVTLFVTGLEFYSHHGVSAAERLVGHRYTVDLDVDIESSAEFTDDVMDTVDYAAIAQLVLEVAGSTQFNTVERLAYVIAEKLLERFTRIERVNLRLSKRLPPAPVIAEELGVELELGRD